SASGSETEPVGGSEMIRAGGWFGLPGGRSDGWTSGLGAMSFYLQSVGDHCGFADVFRASGVETNCERVETRQSPAPRARVAAREDPDVGRATQRVEVARPRSQVLGGRNVCLGMTMKVPDEAHVAEVRLLVDD